jgi:DNA-binding MarR family transcriptional regulator
MLERITASLSSLAPAEQRVAKLVLTDPRAFARLPVRELAERAHVSKPTVVRFCRSMGYDGLADFKLKLAGSVSEGVPFIHRSVDVDDKTGDVLVKVVDNAVAAFLQYRNAASTVALERAAQEGRHGVVHHLHQYITRLVVHVHTAVDEGHALAHAASQLELEVGQPVVAHAAAKAHHGGLAHMGALGQFAHRQAGEGAGVGQHQLGHALLCRGQGTQGCGDAFKHGRSTENETR